MQSIVFRMILLLYLVDINDFHQIQEEHHHHSLEPVARKRACEHPKEELDNSENTFEISAQSIGRAECEYFDGPHVQEDDTKASIEGSH